MKMFLTKYLLETQLWVSGMITCLSLFFGILFSSVDYYRLEIVFFSTLAGYNYMHFHKYWLKYSKKILNLIIFISSLLILFFLIFLENDISLIVKLLFLSIWVVLYNSYFIFLKIRNISLFKIILIATIWSCVIFYIGNNIIPSYSLFISVLLYIIGITIPFDIVDVNRDTIQTIPKMVGVNFSKFISILCFNISFLLFYNNFSQKPDYSIAWGITNLLAALLVLFMPQKNSYFYTRFWIELSSSIPIIIYYFI